MEKAKQALSIENVAAEDGVDQNGLLIWGRTKKARNRVVTFGCHGMKLMKCYMDLWYNSVHYSVIRRYR